MAIIAGNWKMNGGQRELSTMISALEPLQTKNTVIICVPATILATKSANLKIGAQDISAHAEGAYTGEISAKMLADIDIKYTIIGHSERRQYHGETNDIVREKSIRALENNITPIICIGETMDEKNSGDTLCVLERGLRESIPENANGKIIIAYEPRWAIGAGITPTIPDISDAHNFISEILQSMNLGGTPILYGASVNGANANEIMSLDNVGGVLVGGASLKPETFIPIIESI